MLTVNIFKTRGFSAEELKKLMLSAELLEQAINSEQFLNRVLGYEYNGRRGFYGTDLTNGKVLEIIHTGAEKLMPVADNEIDVDITLYTAAFWKKWSVVGYTNPRTVRTWMNRYYFYSYTPAEIAGHIAHEWCHKLGFDHSFSWTKDREHSVPYAIGYLIRDIATEIANKRS